MIAVKFAAYFLKRLTLPSPEKKSSKLTVLHIHSFRRINNFHPTSCRRQTLAGGWPLCLALPVPLLKCAVHPAVVIITMETCPVSTPLPWESTGAPQIYIFHLHAAESCSLRMKRVPSPPPGWPGQWERGASLHPAGTLALG